MRNGSGDINGEMILSDVVVAMLDWGIYIV